ncbi:hypothetical protein CYMTET_44096 [Cymbomonas tetramitiformis]|uniref:CCHC-type domain-containing protein n=1 Tax=Cymbomonas tetramitiformis TaxID=36881 RepID=A0AAE0C224_9CHLO|nr:hypothetical protein CYMTET_44096 [Cymbomonas tetramitiformis]
MNVVGSQIPEGSSSQNPKPKAKGCFKCGKSGHWSRDCTADPSTFIKTPFPESTGMGEDESKSEKPLPKPKKKRPKLQLEDILDEKGIPRVYKTLPTSFRAVYRGRGHEAGDLRRLLDLYKRWHRGFAPFLDFDTFINRMETFGTTKKVQVCLDQLRVQHVHGINPWDLIEPEEADAGGSEQAEVQTEQTASGPNQHAGPEGDDEEGFLRQLEMDDEEEELLGAMEQQVNIVTTSTTITSTQQQRMEENKRRALERLAARKAAAAEAEQSAEPSASPADAAGRGPLDSLPAVEESLITPDAAGHKTASGSEQAIAQDSDDEELEFLRNIEQDDEDNVVVEEDLLQDMAEGAPEGNAMDDGTIEDHLEEEDALLQEMIAHSEDEADNAPGDKAGEVVGKDGASPLKRPRRAMVLSDDEED